MFSPAVECGRNLKKEIILLVVLVTAGHGVVQNQQLEGIFKGRNFQEASTLYWVRSKREKKEQV